MIPTPKTRCPYCGHDTFYIHEDVVNTWSRGNITYTETNGSYGPMKCANCNKQIER